MARSRGRDRDRQGSPRPLGAAGRLHPPRHL